MATPANPNIELTQPEKFHKVVILIIDTVRAYVSSIAAEGYPTVNPVVLGGARRIVNDMNKPELREKLIDDYILHSSQYWHAVVKKDEKFFIDNSSEIFKGSEVPDDVMIAFRDLFIIKDKSGKLLLSVSDRDELWKLFTSASRVALVHLHQQRKKNKHYLPSVNLEKVINLWPDIVFT